MLGHPEGFEAQLFRMPGEHSRVERIGRFEDENTHVHRLLLPNYYPQCRERHYVRRALGTHAGRTTEPPRAWRPLATAAVFEEAPALLVLVEIDIAVRVDPDGMASIPRARRGWTPPTRQHLALQIEEGDQAIQLRYI